MTPMNDNTASAEVMLRQGPTGDVPDPVDHVLQLCLDDGDEVLRRSVPVLIPKTSGSELKSSIFDVFERSNPFGDDVGLQTDPDVDWMLTGVRADTGETVHLDEGSGADLDLREWDSFSLSPRVSGG